MSKYGLRKAPHARKKGRGFLAWVLLLCAVGLIGWLGWNSWRKVSRVAQVGTNNPVAHGVVKTNAVVTIPKTNAPVPVAKTNQPPARNPVGAVHNALEAQVALARLGISSGCIDGSSGFQTRLALRAFQMQSGLPVTGDLDLATKARLLLNEPLYGNYIVSSNDVANLTPIPSTWMEKSEMERLDYETVLELVAEKAQSSMGLIKSLNPEVDWTRAGPGTMVRVPSVPKPSITQKAAFVRIQLRDKTLEAFGTASNLLAHFPCSIAQKVEKRPVGKLTVAKIALRPNYVFDPAIFPESPEARQIDHKLILPPGPNNPVGTAWIGLDKPGYGMHGTPRPEQVGRTESHGCFRLANWNAELLAQMVWVGMPVYVEP